MSMYKLIIMVDRLECKNQKQAQTILELQEENKAMDDTIQIQSGEIEKLRERAKIQKAAYKPVWEDNVRLNAENKRLLDQNIQMGEENQKLMALVKYRQETGPSSITMDWPNRRFRAILNGYHTGWINI